MCVESLRDICVNIYKVGKEEMYFFFLNKKNSFFAPTEEGVLNEMHVHQ